MASFLFLVICGCNSQTGGIKGKKQNEQFFDKSFVLKDLSPYDTEYNISRMAGWVKVGQTYTFSKVNYKDRLESPSIWRQTYLKITFNDNRTVTIKGEGQGKTLKVVHFRISNPCYSVFDESSYFIEIRMNVGNETDLILYKKENNNKYGRNIYGMFFKSDNYIYCTGTPTEDSHFGNRFDY